MVNREVVVCSAIDTPFALVHIAPHSTPLRGEAQNTYHRMGGFHAPQSDSRIGYKTISDLNPVADNPSTGDNQAGCRLLFMFSLGNSTGHLVEGVACLQDWQSLSD
jgi:hypothetical protein